MEDYENQAPPQSAFVALGPGRREPDGASSFVSSSDDDRIRWSCSCLAATRTCSCARTGKDDRKHARGSQTPERIGDKIRDSQDPGVVCNIRPRILRLERLVGRQQCGSFRSGQTSHGVHELAFFRGPPGLERREIVGKRPLFPRSWRRIDSLGASEPSKHGKRRLRVFRDDRSRQQSGALWPWKCAGPAVRRRLCSPWSVRSLSPTRSNAVTQTFEFVGPDGGWSPKFGDTFVPSDQYREKQNRRGGPVSTQNDVYAWSQCSRGFSDDSHKTTFCSTWNYAEYLLLFRRAAANLQVDMVPHQGRHSQASVDRAENLRTLESIQKRGTMEISQVCAQLREKRTCQPKLVRARSIGPCTLQALQQPPAFGMGSTQFFDILASGQTPRRNALAASIFAFCCQNSPTFAKRDTTLGIASSEKILTIVKSPKTICVSSLVCGWSKDASV